MLATLMFDQSRRDVGVGTSGLWLAGGAALTVAYVVCALVLVGVPGFSRLGVLAAGAAALWLVVGLVSRQATFPPVLLLPLGFYAFCVVTGLGLDAYPSEYIGTLTTVWIGAIAIAAFVANGVSINLLIGGFALVCVANLAAIAVGYDGYRINVQDYSADSLEGVEIHRYTGLAGQANLLVALTFVLPFVVFLPRRKIGTVAYLILFAGCVGFTLLTGSRSAIAFTLLFAVGGALFLLGSSMTRTVAIGIGLLGTVLFLVFISQPGALSRVERSRIGQFTVVERTISGLEGDDNSAEVRDELATEFWPQFSQRPLLGYGPNQFQQVSGEGLYAHNNFAEIAIDGGIVGLVLYYAMYGFAFMAIIGAGAGRMPAIVTLVFLVAADNWFVTMVERPLVLLLCLTLVMTVQSAGSRGGGRHARGSGRGTDGRRRRRRYR